jgi:uncharacterized protein YehS (DUF1456 family)
MNNNDIIRRIRYIFDFSDDQMIALFGAAEHEVTRQQISDWMKKEDDPAYQTCCDRELALFLNGLINEKRGKREGPQAEPEDRLNNNIIFRKLRIALNLKDDAVLDVLALAGFRLSKGELSAFFRQPKHKHFRLCKDQVLRNFLNGLQMQHRPKENTKPVFTWQ